MADISIEHTSIILEGIAFFFVTIDLYGEERLEALRDAIIDISGDIAKWLIGILGSSVFFTEVIYRTSYIAANVSNKRIPSFLEKFLHVNKFIEGHFVNHPDWADFILWMLTLFIYALIIILFLFMLYIVFELIFMISKLVSYKGLMITAGTILFVISKVIAYNNV